MSLEERAVVAQLLQVIPPWRVTEVQLSATSQTITVRIERLPARSGFFSRRSAPAVRRMLRWEHLAVAGLRCRVMVELRDGDVLPVDAPWLADEGQPYTNGLQRQIMDLLLAGATPEQLAILLRLPFADIWRYKFRLDRGGASPPALVSHGEPSAAKHSAASRPAVGAMAASTHGRVAIPGEGSPVWLALLLGRMPLDVRALSLRLLLAKLQREAALHGDADLHRQACSELYRYFARSSASLRHEVAQLATFATQAVGSSLPRGTPRAAAVAADGIPAPAFELPDASDPLWMALLDGGCELDVRVLGLKLLLAKLRAQIRSLRNDEVRMLKLVELHRYFTRHQGALGHEIAQIRHWQAPN